MIIILWYFFIWIDWVCVLGWKNEGSYYGNYGSKYNFDGWWCYIIWILIVKVLWELILLVCVMILLWNFVILWIFDV